MNYEQFVNQQVTNYKGQTGTIISFNKERVFVRYDDIETSYNPDVAFKNKALIFVKDELNNLINSDIKERDQASIAYQQKIDKIHQEAVKRNKMASDKYIELEKKEMLLKRLFGSDFIYPPFAELKKKFPHAKRKKKWYEWFIGSIATAYGKTNYM